MPSVCPRNPATRLPAVKVPGGQPKPAPTTVLTAALDAASERERLMIGLAAFAGLRRAEIAELPWSAMTWQGLRVHGKGGKARLVPLLPVLSGWLDAEHSLREVGQVGAGYRYPVDPTSPYVFPSHIGGHLFPDTVGQILAKALGSGWTGHTLRHRFATMAYAVDRDLLTLQQLLGHSKPETTARYTAVPQGASMAAVMGSAA